MVLLYRRRGLSTQLLLVALNAHIRVKVGVINLPRSSSSGAANAKANVEKANMKEANANMPRRVEMLRRQDLVLHLFLRLRAPRLLHLYLGTRGVAVLQSQLYLPSSAVVPGS